MRLAGAVLSSLLVVSLAAAEPAKQAAPKKAETAKQAPAKAKKAAAPKADKKAALDAIAASYNAIPLAERLAIQNDLAWTGDYNGAVNGEFGERAIGAVKAFQKRQGGKETGVLNPTERAALGAAAKPKQDAVGWRVVDDGATRRAHRHSGQARSAGDADHRRHALGVVARRIFGRDVPHRAARHDALPRCSSG